LRGNGNQEDRSTSKETSSNQVVYSERLPAAKQWDDRGWKPLRFFVSFGIDGHMWSGKAFSDFIIFRVKIGGLSLFRTPISSINVTMSIS
jgi:hypothetical protein